MPATKPQRPYTIDKARKLLAKTEKTLGYLRDIMDRPDSEVVRQASERAVQIMEAKAGLIALLEADHLGDPDETILKSDAERRFENLWEVLAAKKQTRKT